MRRVSFPGLLGWGLWPEGLRPGQAEEFPPAVRFISAANYMFMHFVVRVQQEHLTGGSPAVGCDGVTTVG